MPEPSEGTSPTALLAVAALSAAMLALEITLTRLFALAQFYHFAFMVVSLALLGVGASGSLLSAWPRLGRRPGVWCAGFAVAALVSFAVLSWVPFDSYAMAWDRRQLAYLVLTFLGACAPFLFAGLVVGAQLARDVAGAHRVYGANMIGSALGSLLALPLIAGLGGEAALLVSAATGLVAAALFWLGPVGRRAGLGVAALAGAGALLAVALVAPDGLRLQLSPYKGLSQVLRAEGARRTVSRWDPAGRVDVVESQAIHVLPGLSQNALIPHPPRQAGLTVDGDNLAPITAMSPDDDLAAVLATNVPSALAAELRPGARWLVLNPAGGWPVLTALAAGAAEVTALEGHPGRAEVVRDDYAEETGRLYRDARVTLLQGNPRAILRQGEGTFDVVESALADSFHPVTSGAFSLTEDYRYTVEALSDQLGRLGPDGLLVVTRWLQTPPTESLRTVAALDAALRARGVDRPGDHLAALRSLRTITFVASAAPLSADERDTTRAFADSRGYDLVWLPDLRAEEANRHQRLPDAAYADAFAALLEAPGAYVVAHPYDIRPPTDDRPFFFHYFRWRQAPEILAGLGQTWQPFGGSGYLVLVVLLGLVLALSGLLIAGPLLVGAPRRALVRVPRGVLSVTVVYFGALGLGYLFALIPLSQRFIVFLDQPAAAMAVVFFAVLLFSGLGSTMLAPRARLTLALPLLAVVVVAMPLVLRAVFEIALGWSYVARLATSVAVLAPLGLLMGIPFARGLAVVEARAPGLTPWAWAVNGSASVVAGVVAVMIAVSWGFSVVLWSGAAAYAVAALAIRRLTSTPGATTLE